MSQPKQPRGKERYEAILAACATLLVQHNGCSFSMQQLSREAATSNGSIYHFFPDKASILSSLWQRHLATLRGLLEASAQIDDTQWRRWHPGEVIDRMTMPLLRHIAAHGDFIILWRWALQSDDRSRDDELKSAVDALYLKVLHLRLPGASHVDKVLVREMLMTIPMGILHPITADRRVCYEQLLLQECREALVAYLGAAEARFAPYGAC